MPQSEPPILLASGHARPIRTVMGQVPAILLGAGFLWLASLGDWRDFQHFFLWLLLFVLGAALLGGAGYWIASALSGYPKIVLMEGWLISFGLAKPTLRLELAQYGKAEVVQFGRSPQTALAFHSLVEETALARTGIGHAPTHLNATRVFPLTFSVDNDYGRAQAIADRVNQYRTGFVGQANLDSVDVQAILNRKMNAHIWGFASMLGAVALAAIVLWTLLPR